MGAAYRRQQRVHKVKADVVVQINKQKPEWQDATKTKSRGSWNCPTCGRKGNTGESCSSCLGRVRVPASLQGSEEQRVHESSQAELSLNCPRHEFPASLTSSPSHPCESVPIAKKRYNLPPDLLELDMELDREEREAEEAEELERRRKEEERRRLFETKQSARIPYHQAKAQPTKMIRSGQSYHMFKHSMRNDGDISTSVPNSFKYSSEGSRRAQAKPRTRPLREAAAGSWSTAPPDVRGLPEQFGAKSLQGVLGKDGAKIDADPVPPPLLSPMNPMGAPPMHPMEAPQLLRMTNGAACVKRHK
mmetsp:Transcript_116649/g.184549  ORF Transcript_116649/g.184549 Transcript_116649/m.184549 type:complete len:304 (+) Transcript_116649:32-943(+)